MISDETLMAFADGELAPDLAGEIERALADDAGLRTRLAALQRGDDLIREAFDAELERPVPDRLVALVQRAAPSAPPLSAAPRSPLQSASRPRWRRVPAWVGMAIAAQVTLLIVAGFILRPSPAAPAQYRALAAAPSRVAAANLIVVFKPEATEAGMTAALKRLDARIVGGPTSTDALLVRVTPTDRDAAVRSLQARPDVALAAAIDAGAPQ
jgi:anti-sigma factor RsiW